MATTLEVHAAPGTRPGTPAASSNQPVFQQPPATQTLIMLLGIDPASGRTRWVQGESLGNGSPIAFLPIDQGVVIPLTNGQVAVVRD